MNRQAKGMLAGFIATVVLSAIMLMKSAMGLMPQLDVIALLTTLMTADDAAWGWIAHFAIGTVIWGLLFARLDPHLPGRHHWTRGIVFATGAWLLMMILIMPVAGRGLFGLEIGILAPVMTLVLHLVYGAVLGFAYGRMVEPARRPERAEATPSRRTRHG